MPKIIIDVNTPGNGKTYEFQLDDSMPVGQARTTMIKDITETESDNITLIPEKTALYCPDTQKRLPDGETFNRAGIKSGQSLLLC